MDKLFIISLLFLPLYVTAKKKSNNCSKIKNGHFYCYSKETDSWFKVVRKNTIQLEIDLKTNDTFISKVEWIEPCKFTIRLLKRTRIFEPGEEAFNKSFVTTMTIENVTDKFYTFKSVSFSSLYKKTLTLSDTVWYKVR